MRVQLAHFPQKSGSPSVCRRCQAVQRLRQHQCQRVLSGTLPSGEHHRMRKAIARQHIAQAMDGFAVTVKIRKRHKPSLFHHGDTESRRNALQELSRKFLRVSVTPW